MTSYTSDNTQKQAGGAPAAQKQADSAPAVNPLKSAFAYVIATVFCALFGAVYELFSHEVYSYYMIYAFAIPLVLGVLPNLAAALFGWCAPGKRAANAWNSGVAALTVGCIFQGALEIYGTTNQLAVVYPVVAAVLLVAGVVFHVRSGSPAKEMCAEEEVAGAKVADAESARGKRFGTALPHPALFRLRAFPPGELNRAEAPQVPVRAEASCSVAAATGAGCWGQVGGAR